jgi:hypothetical protein
MGRYGEIWGGVGEISGRSRGDIARGGEWCGAGKGDIGRYGKV